MTHTRSVTSLTQTQICPPAVTSLVLHVQQWRGSVFSSSSSNSSELPSHTLARPSRRNRAAHSAATEEQLTLHCCCMVQNMPSGSTSQFRRDIYSVITSQEKAEHCCMNMCKWTNEQMRSCCAAGSLVTVTCHARRQQMHWAPLMQKHQPLL